MFAKLKKIKNYLLIFFALIILVMALSLGTIYAKKDLRYGVTYSKKQSEDLGLDWQKVYLAMLDELQIKKLRLVAYWDEIEGNKDAYDWQSLDWQVARATEHDAEIILAVGGRLPRWPECHYPDWTNDLTESEQESKILDYITQTIVRYREQPLITAWQIENEPFLLNFGECPKLNKKLLDREIALVRQLDSRPIVVTDSGELSWWVSAAKRADIFGTTMYRNTYSSKLDSYIHYPIGPSFFIIKRNLARIFAQPKDWLVIELQAEPWGPSYLSEMDQAERDRTMSLEKFKEMIEFSSQTGFREFYLWGVEWWYWEKEKNNRPGFWEYTKTIYKNE